MQFYLTNSPYITSIVLLINLNTTILFQTYYRPSRSLDIKKRKRIGDRGNPQGIPVYIVIGQLINPRYTIYIVLIVIKQVVTLTSQYRQPFLYRIYRSLSQEILSKALLILRQSIETILFRFTFYIVLILLYSRCSTIIIDLYFQPLSQFYSSRLLYSTLLIILLVIIFLITLVIVRRQEVVGQCNVFVSSV